MRIRYSLAICTVIVCAFLAGCVYVPQGDEVNITLSPADSKESVPISVSENGIEIDGFLITGGGAADRRVYRDISVRLYGSNRTLMCIEQVGDWNVTTGTKDITFETSSVPQYIIVYSPDFWNEKMTVEYFEYVPTEMIFRSHEAASAEELPVDISETQVDSC